MAGSQWFSLTAGRIAKASQVNANLAWLEGSIVPMNGGSVTSTIHDLGTTTAYWRGAYITGLNPTTTARGIAVGTTTVAQASDVAFEVAGVRAQLLPRLTTVQRGNLAGINGMVIYNSTANQFQMYQNGGWTPMGGGALIGVITKVRVTDSVGGVTLTALSIGPTVSGRAHYIFGAGTGATSPIFSVVADSMATADITIAGSSAGVLGFLMPNVLDSSADLAQTTATNQLDMYFRDQFKVFFRSSGGVTTTANIIYERSA